jgi:hypothetical protein
MLGTRRRGPLGLVALLLAGIACLLASAPSWGQGIQQDPSSDPNPTSTNIPYLAWQGENIRLVKCSDDLQDSEINVLRNAADRRGEFLVFADLDYDFVLEDFSGSRDPSPISSSSGFFIAGNKLCVRETWTSLKAGLARIKLAVNVNTTSIGLDRENRTSLIQAFQIIQRTSLLQHQFLAGWMTMNDPAITELPLGGDGPNDQGNPLGSGVLNSFWADNVYRPDRRNEGILQAKVTGTMPVDGMGNVKLPDQWPALAQALATDANPNNENPAFRWDIQDQSDLGSFTTEGHPYAPVDGCDPLTRPLNLPAGILDAVDNCSGGYAFSRVFDADGPGALAPVWLGLTNNNSRGPFDPQREDETLMGDGQLTADDAPMPAARIDFTIQANKGGNDIDGVGSFGKTNKNDLYSADRPANANSGSGDDTPHNLYAPFYRAYVPATGAPAAESSGTDGLPGNNFSGYLVGDGNGGEGDRQDNDRLYDYWDIAHEFVTRTLTGTETQCLRREDEPEWWRMTPEGPQKVAIYTDEHGIGDVNFRPGSGFWFDAIRNTQPDVSANLNGGCDLKYLKDNVLGHANITAAAQYPNQPTGSQPAGTAAITKTVKSLFAKYLAVYPKGTTAELRNARIVIAHAQDIDGSPFANEVVCFSDTSPSGTVQAFTPGETNQAQKIGPYVLTGQVRVDDPINSQSDKRVCIRTNDYGNASVEVLESQGAEINIIGDFTAERILRDVKVPFGEATPSVIDAGIPPRAAGASTDQPQGPPPVNANGNSTPTAATLAAVTNGNVQVSSSRSRRLRASRVSVRFARVVNSARGTRYLSLRLKSTKKSIRSVRVRIRLIGYNGRTVKTLRRTVVVGRTVRLRNVRLGANVRNVRVSIITSSRHH